MYMGQNSINSSMDPEVCFYVKTLICILKHSYKQRSVLWADWALSRVLYADSNIRAFAEPNSNI